MNAAFSGLFSGLFGAAAGTPPSDIPAKSSSLFRDFSATLAAYIHDCEGQVWNNSMLLLSFVILATVILTVFFRQIRKGFQSNEEAMQASSASVFLVLLVFGVVYLFVPVFDPSLNPLSAFLRQNRNTVFPFLYTVMLILLFILAPAKDLDRHAAWLLPVLALLGIAAFYQGFQLVPGAAFNLSFERVKVLVLFLCLITTFCTFYYHDPGHIVREQFGYAFLLAMVLAAFLFVYLIVLMLAPSALGDDGGMGFASRLFSSFSTSSSSASAASATGPSMQLICSELGLGAFLLILSLSIYGERKAFFADKRISSSVLLISLLIVLGWVYLIFVQALTVDRSFFAMPTVRFVSTYREAMLSIVALVILSLSVGWAVYVGRREESRTKVFLNVALMLVLLAFFYKALFPPTPFSNQRKEAFGSLWWNLLFYVPCVLSDAYQWLAKWLAGPVNVAQQVPLGSSLMLLTAVLLLVAYVRMPMYYNRKWNQFLLQGGTQLHNDPVSTAMRMDIGQYRFPRTLRYAISFWCFLPALAPNTNAAYSRFANLLDIGAGKLQCRFHAQTNTLQIIVREEKEEEGSAPANPNHVEDKEEDKEEDKSTNHATVLFATNKPLLQKWNHIVINAQGETVDVFVNGVLAGSATHVLPIPAEQPQPFVVGENDGVVASVCNVVCFNHPLQTRNIARGYTWLKSKSPPTLDSDTDIRRAHGL